MKRWIRRILLGCSIGLMVLTLLLRIRAEYATEYVAYRRVGFYNMRDVVKVYFFPRSTDRSMTFRLKPLGSRLGLSLPRIERSPGGILEFSIPHWLTLVAGAAYPALGWLRYRRKDVGFPVEQVGPRMDTNVHE